MKESNEDDRKVLEQKILMLKQLQFIDTGNFCSIRFRNATNPNNILLRRVGIISFLEEVELSNPNESKISTHKAWLEMIKKEYKKLEREY